MNTAPHLAPSEVAHLQRLTTDFAYFAQTCLMIRTKAGELVPLKLNRAQRFLHERLERQRAKGKVRAVIVKGRQLGISTYLQARFYWRLWRTTKALRAFILTHHDDATTNLFGMAQRFHDNMPPSAKPATKAANAKELVFADSDCGYQVATAGSKEVGRSQTIQLLHGSEVPSWPNAESHVVSLLTTALAKTPETEGILEATAKGIGNVFHRMCMAAVRHESEYEAVFIPWFWGEDYEEPCPADTPFSDEWIEYGQLHKLTWEQLFWAYKTNRELAQAKSLDPAKICPDFRQEYPACIAEGERVGTHRGIVPIREVCFEDATNTGYVSAVMNNGQRDTVRITTSLGYTLVCTPDHQLEGCDGEWWRAGEALGQRIKLRAPMFATDQQEVGWRPLACVESRMHIGPETARFLGYFMGDGCWMQRGGFSICCDAQDEDVIEDVYGLVNKHVGAPSLRRVGTKRGGAEVRANNGRFGEVLGVLDVLNPSPPYRRVCVPECIWRSPKLIVREFLRGLFEADGFAAYNAARVSLFSKHKQFLQDVQLLLLGFGITSRLTSETKRNGDGREYQGNALTLRAAETRQFIAEIGFVSARKTERLLAYKPCGRGRPSGILTLSDEVVSIEPAGIRTVFDLSIPGSHKFDASGFSVHNCFDEAFQSSGDSFIPALAVLRARRPEQPIIGRGPVILGVDPARDRDRVGIIDRCGRRLGERICETWPPEGDVIYLAQKIATMIKRIQPDAVNIDVGGVGAGVYDQLCNMGYADICNAVNFGSAPLGLGPTGDRMYANRRAEMWDGMRDWFDQEGGVQIPDSDALHADLTAPVWGPQATRERNNALVLEEKEKIKERLGHSPDLGDAAALTFALPLAWTMQAQQQPRPKRRTGRGGY